MADEEDFTDELQAIDDGTTTEEHDEVVEGTDAPLDAGGDQEGDDEPGAERQAGAPGNQSEGAQNRGLSRQARLANELRETKERALQHERELQELKARLTQVTQPRGESPEQRQARLDAMTTEERLTFLWQESEQRAQQQRAYDQFIANDRQDQMAYQQRMQTDKRAAKYKDEVEGVLQNFRRNGFNPAREHVFYYVLGQKVASATKPSKAQTEGVARRQAATRTTPAATGGDVGRASRSTSLEKKLDGVLL